MLYHRSVSVLYSPVASGKPLIMCDMSRHKVKVRYAIGKKRPLTMCANARCGIVAAIRVRFGCLSRREILVDFSACLEQCCDSVTFETIGKRILLYAFWHSALLVRFANSHVLPVANASYYSIIMRHPVRHPALYVQG